MNEYTPNSPRQKESADKKKIEKVISGTAKVKKKSEFRKFADIFIAEDVDSVKSYIFSDVIIPAAKKLVSDIVRDGIDMILYGGSGRSGKSSSSSKISYRNYYDDKNDRFRSNATVKTRFDYDDLLFETRAEAENVLDQMVSVIDKYGFVTVADMYDMADLTAPYTSAKYGWTNIRTADIVRNRDGYVIKLPKAMPID